MTGTTSGQGETPDPTARYSHLGLNLPASNTSTSSIQGPTPLSPPPTQATSGSTTIRIPRLLGSGGASRTQGAPISSTPSGDQGPVQSATSGVAPVLATRSADAESNASRALIKELKMELAALRSLMDPNPASTTSTTNRGEGLIPTSHPATNLPDTTLHRLFEDDDTLARIKEIFAASKEENGKKGPLPEIVPGFKASSLDLRKSSCFSLFACVPPCRIPLRHPLGARSSVEGLGL